ncbi:MAG: DUF3943 domain-containing protein [Bacteriovoracaceae bacterium]|nr:DUF3943 domain-containing protein [Bacteriovoracaceae bacterium]
MKIFSFLIIFVSFTCLAQGTKDRSHDFPKFTPLDEILESPESSSGLDDPNKNRRIPKYIYGYKQRDHTLRENFNQIAGIYGVTWVLYPLTQPSVVKENGSFKNYRNNFGKLVFDKDEPFWNWFVHPMSGSQLFLYYRANGYSRIDSLAMAFVSSTLFEFTVEIYTEPASVQDLYQTPILGSILGVGIENLSMYLLNSGNSVGRFFGHLINPSTLFWFYEGKVRFIPQFDNKQTSATFVFEF